VYDDLGWKNQTTRYILPRHWLYEWFSQFHSCGTFSVLSRSPSVIHRISYKPTRQDNISVQFMQHNHMLWQAHLKQQHILAFDWSANFPQRASKSPSWKLLRATGDIRIDVSTLFSNNFQGQKHYIFYGAQIMHFQRLSRWTICTYNSFAALYYLTQMFNNNNNNNNICTAVFVSNHTICFYIWKIAWRKISHQIICPQMSQIVTQQPATLSATKLLNWKPVTKANKKEPINKH